MVVKFFPNKKGGSSKAVNYLLNHREQEGTARTLKGDPELTRQIINSIQFKQKTTVGCLSFEEENITEEMKYQLMEDFENHLLPGMQDRYNILWVEHTDKGRLELNFVIPKIDLETQKSLNPYYHKADLPRVEKWQDLQNLKYGYSNPKDPSKERTLQTDSKQIGLSKDYEQLDKLLHNLTEQGQINNREQLIELLQSNNIEVTRKGKDYLSIKLPDSKKAKKFKGSIYDEKFTSVREFEAISKTAEQRVRAYNNRDTQAEQQQLTRELESYTREKEQKLTAIYSSVGRGVKGERNRATQERIESNQANGRGQARKRKYSQAYNSNYRNSNRNRINSFRRIISKRKQTVSKRQRTNGLFLDSGYNKQAVNNFHANGGIILGVISDSIRATTNKRVGTRESFEYKNYRETSRTRNELLTVLNKTAKELREQSLTDSKNIRAEDKPVARAISRDDESREERLLKQARENYRAFDQFKRIAERVTESVRQISEKVFQFGEQFEQFCRSNARAKSDNLEQISEVIKQREKPVIVHHHQMQR
jgi:hypothetical protein